MVSIFAACHYTYYRSIVRNFIDDLMTSFQLNEYISDASFGYVFNKNTSLQHLFIAMGISADEEEIKTMTWYIKSKYYPDAVFNFASSLSDPAIYTYIKENNFSFYEREKQKILEPKILQYFLDPVNYRLEVIEVIRQASLLTLAKDVSMESEEVTFKTYFRENGEYIPLFTDIAMVEKSGVLEGTDQLTPMTINFERLHDLLGTTADKTLYVLNPGSLFEVEFIA